MQNACSTHLAFKYLKRKGINFRKQRLCSFCCTQLAQKQRAINVYQRLTKHELKLVPWHLVSFFKFHGTCKWCCHTFSLQTDSIVFLLLTFVLLLLILVVLMDSCCHCKAPPNVKGANALGKRPKS